MAPSPRLVRGRADALSRLVPGCRNAESQSVAAERRWSLGPPAAVGGHPASIMSTSGGGGTDPRAAGRSSWGSEARPRQRRRADKGAAWSSRYGRGMPTSRGQAVQPGSSLQFEGPTGSSPRVVTPAVVVGVSRSKRRRRLAGRAEPDHAFDRHTGQEHVNGTPGARARLAVMRSDVLPAIPADLRCNVGRTRSGPMSGSSGREQGSATVLVAQNATTRPPGLTAFLRARRPRPEVRRGGGESDGRTPRDRAGRDPA